MNDVRLDPQQVPSRAELLLAAELGEDAPGRPIYTRLELDGHDDGEPTARIKVGAMLTRRLSAAEATETPSGGGVRQPATGPARAGSERADRVRGPRPDRRGGRARLARLPRDPRRGRDGTTSGSATTRRTASSR